MTKQEIAGRIREIISHDLDCDFRPITAFERLMILAEELESIEEMELEDERRSNENLD